MQLDGYIRVSQVRGRHGESFISPAVQREQIERWAVMRGATITKWHTDLDQSGSRQDRPGLSDALQRAEAGVTDGIVVAKLDRFARSLVGALDAIKRLDEAGAQFVSVAEGIDPATPAGKMMQRLMLVLAEFELDRVRESWATARERAVARGVHIASKTPTGYVRGGDGRLVPHPKFGPAIGEAYRMRASGESWRAIAAFLDAAGVVGPYQQEHWRTRAVQHVLSNPAYLGEARSGRFKNAGAHEPLIDPATWEAAQAARAQRPSRGDDPALMAGLLRCAGCRYVMRPDKMTARDGSRVRLYRCRGEHASGVCHDRAAVLGSVIEPFVVARFFAAVGDVRATASEVSSRVDAARVALQQAEAELAAYRDDERIAGVLGADRFVDGLTKRVKAVDAAHRDLAEQTTAAGSAAALGDASLVALWPEMSVPERRTLIQTVLDAVMLRSGRGLPIERRALVLLAGEASDALPGPGRRGPLTPFAWPIDSPVDAGVSSP
jgi:site-specific DNA recombinase